MKYFFLFLSFLIFFSVATTNASASEPERTTKCCQITTTDSKTLCSERKANCVKTANGPEGTYESFGTNSKCMTSGSPVTSFNPGQCSGTSLNANSFSDLELVGTKSGFSASQKGPDAVINYIGKIIKIALSLTGIIFLIYAVYSGIQWMTAGGNSNAVSEARGRLIQAAIGMMITAVAYSAAALIIKIIAG